MLPSIWKFRAKPARRSRSTARKWQFESLEPRLCLAAPTLDPIGVTYGTGRNITVSGHVSDENPASATVTVSGVLAGSVSPNSMGNFSLSGVASGLGTVSAVAVDVESLSSNTSSAQVTSDTPVVSSLSVTETASGMGVTINGTVTDASPAGLTVILSGVVSTSVTTNGSGQFTVNTVATALGSVFASVTDVWGLTSNPASVNLISSPPVISEFGDIAEGGGYYTFTGRVTDEFAPGMTITFGGLLAGQTATVGSDNRFSITVFLGSQAGLVSAITADIWGQNSNTAETLVEVF